ncbi:hypothetical protein BGZ60DRAFT_535835 [Tricladium varicosporioides]|nr:hypothetical protein BGZ60DRAFT_535835 [Hymenoscyphus varicosporioides]
MKGDPEFVILKQTAWLDAKEYEPKILGAIIRYPLQPTKLYLPEEPSPLSYNSRAIQDNTFSDFIQDNTHASSSEISAKLEKVVGINLRGHRDESVRVAGKLVRCKRLEQHGLFWKSLKQDPAVQKEVPGWVSFRNPLPPCLVVGIMIAEDLKVEFKTGAVKEREVKVEAPAAEVASGVLAAAPPAVAGEFSVRNLSIGVTTTNDSNTSFIGTTAQGEGKIFALELLVVTTKFLNWQRLKVKAKGPDVPEGRMAAAGENESSVGEAEKEAMEKELLLGGLSDDDMKKLEAAEW